MSNPNSGNAKKEQWVDNQIYGKLLAGVVRYDVKKTDTDAGFYITYTPGGIIPSDDVALVGRGKVGKAKVGKAK